MIGQTIVNVEMGKARSRLSTIVAGLVLLLLVTALSRDGQNSNGGAGRGHGDCGGENLQLAEYSPNRAGAQSVAGNAGHGGNRRRDGHDQ